METLSLDEAAQFLKFSPEKVKALAENGDLPGARLGSQWRFLRSALEEKLRGTNPQPTPDTRESAPGT